MNRLVTVRESRSSAEQRRGRAGRLGPGVCYRLFSRHTFSAMTPHTPPEILETDLSPLLLELAAWGVSDTSGLAWLDPPPEAAVTVARRLLIQLSALDEGGMITPLGSAMARLPLHPRLARLLLRAEECGCSALGCDLAALLSERDIFRPAGQSVPRHAGDSDPADRLEALAAWRKGGAGRAAAIVDATAVAAVDRTARQLMRLMPASVQKHGDMVADDHVNRLLLAAYPDRLARLRDTGEGRYLLANGRGARLAPVCSVRSAQLLIAVSVAGGDQAEGVIHLAAAVDEEFVRQECGDMIAVKSTTVWNEREGRAVAAREERIGAVRLSSSPCAPPADELRGVILSAVRASNLALLAMNDAARQLQGRVALLRRALPEEEWPDMSDAGLLDTLEEWLAPILTGVRTAQQLASLDVAGILRSRLDYRRQRALDELAPTHIEVPSGSRIRLDYAAGDIPVLAVKLQELFGLADTPSIARGRVGVLLHLLSPAGRPIQVTRDLKGFWNGAYFDVMKELKGRYPRHPWPDDPWSAVPTRRAKPRGR
jgi:ATP-dependent helicase HrpB